MTETKSLIGSTADFPDNSMKPVTVAGHDLVIIHQEGKFYALPDQCTHARYPLSDGELLDGAVKCAYHGAKYNLETGKPTLPAVKKIRLYQTEVEDGQLYVLMQES